MKISGIEDRANGYSVRFFEALGNELVDLYELCDRHEEFYSKSKDEAIDKLASELERGDEADNTRVNVYQQSIDKYQIAMDAVASIRNVLESAAKEALT